MVRITKVHTGGGDTGETSFASGARVGKDHPRIELYGTIDELNAVIGMVRAELDRLEGEHADGGARATVRRARNTAGKRLARIQSELFDLGGECSFPAGEVPEVMGVIGEEESDRLVTEMDSWVEVLAPLESFILPAGSPLIASLHLARTVARRAERRAVELRSIEEEKAVRDVVIAYLNRLSDWFFVLGRWITAVLGEDEVQWTPKGRR